MHIVIGRYVYKFFIRLKFKIGFCNLYTLIILQGLAIAAVRFRFDGQPIHELDTPSTLEMEEGDTIEVYQQQTGGGL